MMDGIGRRQWLTALAAVVAVTVVTTVSPASAQGRGWGPDGMGPPGQRRRRGWVPPGQRRRRDWDSPGRGRRRGPPPGRGWRRWAD